MRCLATGIVLLWSASAALAGSCGPAAEADIPVLEELKAKFLASDYRGFSELLQPYFGEPETVYNSYFPTLERVIPDGFDRCRTILQRRELPGFYQDLVFFFPAGSKAPIALLLIAANDGDGIVPVEFVYNTSISDVLSELK